MYTAVPKHPKNESEKDPYPLLDSNRNWGLTDEEFKLRFAGGKYEKKRKRIMLLKAIIESMRGQNEVDQVE